MFPEKKIILISNQQIEISILKNNKAVGPDGIKSERLKCCMSIIVKPLQKFNLSFSLGIIPKAWTTSYLTPIHKKGSKEDPSNYRGIAT